MKVRVTLTLDINEERWANEFGICVHEVREDVKQYVASITEQHPVVEQMLNPQA